MHRTSFVHAIAATSIISLAACGSDVSPATTAAATTERTASSEPTASLETSVAATLEAIDAEGALAFTHQEATCFAGRAIDDVGEDRLIELGADRGVDLTGLEWTKEERSAVFASLQTCVDLEGQLTTFFAADPAMTPDIAACIAHSYATSDVFPDALFNTEPDPELDTRIDDILTAATDSCTG